MAEWHACIVYICILNYGYIQCFKSDQMYEYLVKLLLHPFEGFDVYYDKLKREIPINLSRIS